MFICVYHLYINKKVLPLIMGKQYTYKINQSKSTDLDKITYQTSILLHRLKEKHKEGSFKLSLGFTNDDFIKNKVTLKVTHEQEQNLLTKK